MVSYLENYFTQHTSQDKYNLAKVKISNVNA